jgi:hypothetical protein
VTPIVEETDMGIDAAIEFAIGVAQRISQHLGRAVGQVAGLHTALNMVVDGVEQQDIQLAKEGEETPPLPSRITLRTSRAQNFTT